jgi:hypothetical protein
MKMMSIVLTAAILTLSAAPAFSEVPQSQKDECLLAAKNCTDQVDDIYKRMHRLAKEIKKGTKVYTPAELKQLKLKLAETQDLLSSLEKPGN